MLIDYCPVPAGFGFDVVKIEGTDKERFISMNTSPNSKPYSLRSGFYQSITKAEWKVRCDFS